MNLQSYLDDAGINYRVSQHPIAYTAQDLAAKEHVPGDHVIKPVVVRADGEYLMCVLPASYRVDMHELRQQLRAEDISLADEGMLSSLCADCELGAEPPIGKLFGIPTLMDEAVLHEDTVTFQAGTHSDAITMSLADYRRLAQPELAHFARHA